MIRRRGQFVLGLACWILSAAMLIAGGLAVGGEGAEVPEFDRAMLGFLATEHRPLLDGFFQVLTWAGSLVVLIPVMAGVIFGLAQFGHRVEAWLLGVSLFGASLITHLAKLVFARPRPAPFDPIVATPSDYSFPSGHSAQISAFVVALLIVQTRIARDARIGLVWFWLAGFALIATVGLSRIYLQVHYVTDVLVGIFVGGLWSMGLYLVGSGPRTPN